MLQPDPGLIFLMFDYLQAKTKASAQRKEIFKRAESYVKEYRQEVRIRDERAL